MTKVDQLIEKFKELKEELNKNMNMSYAMAPNKPNPTVGTSGGQGGMYRSEDMDKNVVAPVTMQMSEDVKKDGMIGQDMMAMAEGETKHDRCAREVGAKGNVDNPHAVCVAAGVKPDKWKKSHAEKLSLAKNGQWKLDKVDPEENVNIPHPQGKAKMANGVNKEEGKELGTNQRLANPPEKSCPDPRGRVHIIKDEGTNEEANPSKPHNKGKFKVMDEVKEKESKKEKVPGLPYNGEDKKVHKNDQPEEQRDQNRPSNRGAFGPA